MTDKARELLERALEALEALEALDAVENRLVEKNRVREETNR